MTKSVKVFWGGKVRALPVPSLPFPFIEIAVIPNEVRNLYHFLYL